MTTEPPQTPRPKFAVDKAQRSRLIGGIVIAVIAIWFILANTHRASIRFWFVTVSSPMWLTLAGTFIAGMLTALLLTRVRTPKQKKEK